MDVTRKNMAAHRVSPKSFSIPTGSSYTEVVNVNNHRRSPRASYSLPLPPVLLIGSLLAASFFGLILAGPLDFAILRRYCLSHPVAIASVSLFCVGIVGLVLKWFRANTQLRVTGKSVAALRRLVLDGEEVSPAQRVDWLLASWFSQPEPVRDSWFGQRIQHCLQLQKNRGRRNNLESDLKTISERDADQQHESYSLLRIINWAMPMLGFLGTVLGISQTLGQLDTEMLATQQQDAMNQLTAGLYVAFDTTAIALTLTVFSMFVQFAVSRIETNVLNRIDTESADGLISYLAVDPFDANDSLLAPVREMASELVDCVRDLVVEQAELWSRSMQESQRQWSDWTERLAGEIDTQLVRGLSLALTDHLTGLERIQDEGTRQIEVRLQQWQTTLSDQSRLMHTQQKELIRQSDTLQRLVESTADLRKLETSLSENMQQVENVGRMENATKCVGEAVAMLASSLERAGVLRPLPQKPRPRVKDVASVDSGGVEATDSRGKAA